MNLSVNRAELHLQAHQVIRLHDPAGARVECLNGTLWITQNRDLRDHRGVPTHIQGTLCHRSRRKDPLA